MLFALELLGLLAAISLVFLMMLLAYLTAERLLGGRVMEPKQFRTEGEALEHSCTLATTPIYLVPAAVTSDDMEVLRVRVTDLERRLARLEDDGA